MSDFEPYISKKLDQGIDFIGDIHGHQGQLLSLLESLGYRLRDGVHHHPDRIAVFLGDYIDRGPGIPRTLEVVRRMVEHDSAIALMGNHEYNALAWFTPRVEGEDLPCRRHTPERQEMFQESLVQLGDQMPEWIDWFRTLPLFIDHPRFRAVHASWNSRSAAFITQQRNSTSGIFNDHVMRKTCVPGSDGFSAIESLLKGPELELPNGHYSIDAKGIARKRIRIRWFESPKGKTYKTYALTNDDNLTDEALPLHLPHDQYPHDDPPVFFGHYWMRGTSPTPLRGNVACLDYSVALGGPLVAYRFDGEDILHTEKFITA